MQQEIFLLHYLLARLKTRSDRHNQLASRDNRVEASLVLRNTGSMGAIAAYHCQQTALDKTWNSVFSGSDRVVSTMECLLITVFKIGNKALHFQVLQFHFFVVHKNCV